MSDRELLDEQVAYYRARAAEYDATSMPDGDRFASHAKRIASALRELAPLGRVIEVAAGTGHWTGLLADMADDLLVTDASPEMLEINRAKTGERTNVRYAVADAFSLDATHAHDTVFFGFFLSHVPPARLEAFWAIVDGLLAPGGRVLFVDEADHGLWTRTGSTGRPVWCGVGALTGPLIARSRCCGIRSTSNDASRSWAGTHRFVEKARSTGAPPAVDSCGRN